MKRKNLFKYILISSLASLTILTSACAKKKAPTAAQINESIQAEREKQDAEEKEKAIEESKAKEQEDKEKFAIKSEEERREEKNAQEYESYKEDLKEIGAVVSKEEAEKFQASTQAATTEATTSKSESESDSTTSTELTETTTQETTSTELDSNDPFSENYTYEVNPEVEAPIDNGDGTVSYDIYALEDGAMDKFFNYIHSGCYDQSGLEGLMIDARSFYDTYPDAVKNACYKEINSIWEEHLRRKALWTEEEIAEDSERLFYSSREEYDAMRASLGDWYVPSSQWQSNN